jgi:uncharacterized protein (DUF111 family)
MLRVIIDESEEVFESDEVTVVSTTIDDMNPENFEYLMELLFEKGAIDVYLTPIQAKKTRPGTLLTMLCSADDTPTLASVLFSESTTFGMRYHCEKRLKLSRDIIEVSTEWGNVRVKIGRGEGKLVTVSPEFEDCRGVARKNKVPLKHVFEAAREAAKKKLEE